VLAEFAQKVQIGRVAVRKQMATSYSRPNAPPLDGGSPGQSDGTGDLLPKFLLIKVLDRKDIPGSLGRYLKGDFPELPDQLATVTDNLSVWLQADRPIGQLDGSLKEPIVRNIAAQTAVVGSPAGSNLKNAEIAARFTAHLPAPPYPFAVDMPRARRGEALFRTHCASCHRAGNENIYKVAEIGTDPNRARVLSPEGKKLLMDNFKAAFLLKDKNFTATRADGTTVKPAELKDDDIINDRTRPDNQGYVAGPLSGIWARAPYLHNGSVPSLRHLLAPGNPESARPRAFVRGVIRYDPLNVGFAWDVREAAALVADAPTAVVFDTGWDGASNVGHVAEVRVKDDGTVDASGLEYLKTL
jgi:mono/diheme cytochrome c family protein